MSITEAIGILEHLDTPVLEVVLDQTRIAYRVQEAVKASARSTNAPAAESDRPAPKTEGE